MCSNTGRTRTKNRKSPVPAIDRGTAATRLTLVTWGGHIPKKSASSPLQKIASHACHVPDLGRRAFQQCLGNDRVVSDYIRVLRDFAHLLQRADMEALRCQFDPSHR